MRFLVILLLISLVGCAGKPEPPTFVDVNGGQFTMKMPKGWVANHADSPQQKVERAKAGMGGLVFSQLTQGLFQPEFNIVFQSGISDEDYASEEGALESFTKQRFRPFVDNADEFKVGTTGERTISGASFKQINFDFQRKKSPWKGQMHYLVGGKKSHRTAYILCSFAPAPEHETAQKLYFEPMLESFQFAEHVKVK